jgi:UDP-N-acetylmuramoyl-tripeptide--D-alanyl-D-alanine ligase
LANIAKPTIAVITNIGVNHIELLGSIENIAVAKSELIDAIDATGLVVLNADDQYVTAMGQKAKSHIVQYGMKNFADIKAIDITMTENSVSFNCVSAQGRFLILLPTIGKHSIYNGLAAIAVGLHLKLSIAEITEGIKRFKSSPMRLYTEKLDEYIIINDVYNASPLSMAAAIDTLVQIAQKRMIAVLGDMLELGDLAVQAHQNVGYRLAAANVTAVITVGNLARYIADAARDNGLQNCLSFSDHKAAYSALQTILQPGDTILVKGSRAMQMENILNYLRNR